MSACTPMHFLKFMESVKVLALSADETSSVRTDDPRPHTRAEPNLQSLASTTASGTSSLMGVSRSRSHSSQAAIRISETAKKCRGLEQKPNNVFFVLVLDAPKQPDRAQLSRCKSRCELRQSSFRCECASRSGTRVCNARDCRSAQRTAGY
jgi:hypothetical protein